MRSDRSNVSTGKKKTKKTKDNCILCDDIPIDQNVPIGKQIYVATWESIKQNMIESAASHKNKWI